MGNEHTPPTQSDRPDPELTSHLVLACTSGHRLHLDYAMGHKVREMSVDPWAVVLRHSKWYLLCWSHSARAQRVLRVDRIRQFRPLPEQFEPPPTLDALDELESHLAQGWEHDVEVIIEAPIEHARYWVRRSLGELTSLDDQRSTLRATTSSPDWYVRQLAVIEAPWKVIGSEAIRTAVAALATELRTATEPPVEQPR